MPITWADFAEAAGEAIGRRPRLLSVAAGVALPIAIGCELLARMGHRPAILNRDRVRELAQARWVCDPSRAIDEIGFDPRYTLERGTRATVAWYRKAGWI
jgi:nucleoside-diphosphate-sugar epimerase